jgi:hypothetical protein
MTSLRGAASSEPASFLVQISHFKFTQSGNEYLPEKYNLLIKKSDSFQVTEIKPDQTTSTLLVRGCSKSPDSRMDHEPFASPLGFFSSLLTRHDR